MSTLWAQVTDQQYNPTKCKLWANSVAMVHLFQGAMALHAQPIPVVHTLNVLGAEFRALDAPQGEACLPVQRMKDATRHLDRIATMPGPLILKAQVAASLVLSAAAHAHDTSLVPAPALKAFETRMIQLTWRGGTNRAPEILHPLLLKGHNFAMRWKAATQVLAQVHRQLRDPPFCAMWKDLHEAEGRLTSFGLLRNFRAALATMGWTWPTPFVLRAHDGTDILLLGNTTGALLHLAREALRLQAVRSLSRRRASFAGLQGGLDREATKCLYDRIHDAYLQGFARNHFAGGVDWGTLRVQKQWATDPICLCCRDGDDYSTHLFYQCAETARYRAEALLLPEWLSTLPACLSHHRVVPCNATFSRLRVARLQALQLICLVHRASILHRPERPPEAPAPLRAMLWRLAAVVDTKVLYTQRSRAPTSCVVEPARVGGAGVHNPLRSQNDQTKTPQLRSGSGGSSHYHVSSFAEDPIAALSLGGHPKSSHRVNWFDRFASIYQQEC